MLHTSIHRRMISLLFVLFPCNLMVETRHFNGGIINWRPIYFYANLNKVSINITQSYSWNASEVRCDIDVPITTRTRNTQVTNLTCLTHCSTDGGYSLRPINTLTDCQTINTLMNVMTSQRSININLTAGAHFTISYSAGDWIPLNYPPSSGLRWSMTCLINLGQRPDSLINTPPTVGVVSPQYAIANCTTEIIIPIFDINIGDDIRCRWAIRDQSVNECGGICYPDSVPNGTVLSGCSILFRGGNVANIWYAIALQVDLKRLK